MIGVVYYKWHPYSKQVPVVAESISYIGQETER